MKRIDQINHFLAKTNWADARLAPLAGDASNRRYFRAYHKTLGHAVIMDAPLKNGNDITPFLNIAQHLRSIGVSSPQIHAADTDLGLILMQDFGDDLVFDMVIRDPSMEHPLYDLALDVVDIVQRHPPPKDIPNYMAVEMTEAASFAPVWWGQTNETDAVLRPLGDALSSLDWSNSVMILRDYHAQNLVWRAGKVGINSLGVLDFQDAMLGHPLFDAASLIGDARRDVTEEVRQNLLTRLRHQYVDFDRQFAVINVQRNLRILGIFARLCLRDGKAHYLDFVPRVWRNLQADTAQADLAEILDHLPNPTPEYLERLRNECATHQQM